ncbi:hypothetical protein Agub_g12681, partial [Astrephomene gubernaculifera]
FRHRFKEALLRMASTAAAARLAYPVGLMLRGPTPPLALAPVVTAVAPSIAATSSSRVDEFASDGFTLDGLREVPVLAPTVAAAAAAAAEVAGAAAAGGAAAAAAADGNAGNVDSAGGAYGRGDEDPGAAGRTTAAATSASLARATASRTGNPRCPVPLWAACLPAAVACTTTTASSTTAAVAAASDLPIVPPLRVCRTPEAAAEAVDLTLLALRGPFGTPLNSVGGLGAYGRDLELLLPVRGPDLRNRLAAIRHSLAPTATTAAAGPLALSYPEAGMLRIRLGCGACAACTDPWATSPCLRPLSLAYEAFLLRFIYYEVEVKARAALRWALGWDPVAAHAAAARAALGLGLDSGRR